MRLAKLSEFRRMIYAEGSGPSLTTLRIRINSNEIPGGRIEHGHYYVDMDEYDRATGLRSSLAAQQAEAAKDPLLAGLI